MITRNLGAAVVIAFGLIVATFLHGGIYEFRYAETAPAFVVYRINRFTGRVSFCNGIADKELGYGCATLPEK
jgi:hypothetical protein